MPEITYIYIPISPDKLKEMFASIIETELLKHKLIQLPEPPKEEYIDIHAAAQILLRTRCRLYGYVRAGILPAYKIPQLRGLRFKKHEVENLFTKLDFRTNISLRKPDF